MRRKLDVFFFCKKGGRNWHSVFLQCIKSYHSITCTLINYGVAKVDITLSCRCYRWGCHRGLSLKSFLHHLVPQTGTLCVRNELEVGNTIVRNGFLISWEANEILGRYADAPSDGWGHWSRPPFRELIWFYQNPGSNMMKKSAKYCKYYKGA